MRWPLLSLVVLLCVSLGCGGDDPEPRTDGGSIGLDASAGLDARAGDAAGSDATSSDATSSDAADPPDAADASGDCPPVAGACFTVGASGCCADPSPAACVAGDWVCPAGKTLIDRCPPCPPSDWASCDVTSECVLAASTCCGVCGLPSIDDVDGVNAMRREAHFAEVCPIPEPCPDCPSQLNPELQVTCKSSRCEPFDVRKDESSACDRDEDCRVRVAQCCECGGDTSPFALIAVSSEAAYSALVCDPMTGCPECAPVYPDDVRAICAPDGHCAIAGR